MSTSLHCAMNGFVARLPRPSCLAAHDKQDRVYTAVQQAVTRLTVFQREGSIIYRPLTFVKTTSSVFSWKAVREKGDDKNNNKTTQIFVTATWQASCLPPHLSSKARQRVLHSSRVSNTPSRPHVIGCSRDLVKRCDYPLPFLVNLHLGSDRKKVRARTHVTGVGGYQ